MLIERDLVVLYGSQTGTAEEVAESIVRDGIRRHFSTVISSLDEYDMKTLPAAKLVVFVCSTTGQGDPPENMMKFWKFLLRRNLPADSLCQLKYAVIGLGDSSYQKYNFVAKKLFKRLSQLSGTPLAPLILCDDQHDLGLDAGLDSNVPDLWETILDHYPLSADRTIIPNSEILHPKYRISALDDQNSSEHAGSRLRSSSSVTSIPTSAHPHPALLLSNQRITESSHFQDVRLIRLDISGSNIRYSPGDVAYIRPQNSTEVVNQFLSLLSLDPNQKIGIQPHENSGLSLNDRLAEIHTWRELATHYLDLNSIPRRYFFELMSHFSKDELEKEKLQDFCSPEGQDERFAYCNRVRRTLVEVLTEFRHTTPNIPVNYILDLIPALQPRAFSIASAQSEESSNVIELLMAVVKYKTKLSDPRLGVCSNWLANLKPDSGHGDGHTALDSTAKCDRIPVWTQPGTLRFPTNGEACIMIGPGTGVAPFRSFIQHRISQSHKENLLVFGCRHRDADFLCKDEWETMASTEKLTLLTAFSRDQDEKFYVWNALLDNSKLIWEWIEVKKAFIFIAGNAKRMPDDVRASLLKIIEEQSSSDGEEYLQGMEKSGRYQLECWS